MGIQTPEMPDLSNGPVGPAALLALQQTIGNNAVGDLVRRQRDGRPLPSQTRHDMESSFGRNFGQVQIRSGPEVDEAAQALHAVAFTAGDDIYVHSDLPDFDDPFGRAVLGEELAHVAQGAGQDGIGRVTDPGETGEHEARTAGRAAAEGEHASLTSAPEMEGAVARFSLSEIFGTVGAAVAAGAAEKTDLGDDEKDRLSAGALTPLNGLLPLLEQQQTAAQGGQPSPKALRSIAVNSDGISVFILSFTGPPAVRPTIEAAAQGVANGRQAILGAMDPVGATKASAGILLSQAVEISALASPAQPANTPTPANAPPATPAPAAPPVPAPAAATPADALTPAEADQLKFGAVEPLNSVAGQLKEEDPDLETIIARLEGVPGVLRSFTKPAALVPQLHDIALRVEGQVARLRAVASGPAAALSIALIEWINARGLLLALTFKSPAGGAPAKVEAPASGDDEDKKKPN